MTTQFKLVTELYRTDGHTRRVYVDKELLKEW